MTYHKQTNEFFPPFMLRWHNKHTETLSINVLPSSSSSNDIYALACVFLLIEKNSGRKAETMGASRQNWRVIAIERADYKIS